MRYSLLLILTALYIPLTLTRDTECKCEGAGGKYYYEEEKNRCCPCADCAKQSFQLYIPDCSYPLGCAGSVLKCLTLEYFINNRCSSTTTKIFNTTTSTTLSQTAIPPKHVPSTFNSQATTILKSSNSGKFSSSTKATRASAVSLTTSVVGINGGLLALIGSAVAIFFIGLILVTFIICCTNSRKKKTFTEAVSKIKSQLCNTSGTESNDSEDKGNEQLIEEVIVGKNPLLNRGPKPPEMSCISNPGEVAVDENPSDGIPDPSANNDNCRSSVSGHPKILYIGNAIQLPNMSSTNSDAGTRGCSSFSLDPPEMPFIGNLNCREYGSHSTSYDNTSNADRYNNFSSVYNSPIPPSQGNISTTGNGNTALVQATNNANVTIGTVNFYPGNFGLPMADIQQSLSAHIHRNTPPGVRQEPSGQERSYVPTRSTFPTPVRGVEVVPNTGSLLHSEETEPLKSDAQSNVGQYSFMNVSTESHYPSQYQSPRQVEQQLLRTHHRVPVQHSSQINVNGLSHHNSSEYSIAYPPEADS